MGRRGHVDRRLEIVTERRTERHLHALGRRHRVDDGREAILGGCQDEL